MTDTAEQASRKLIASAAWNCAAIEWCRFGEQGAVWDPEGKAAARAVLDSAKLELSAAHGHEA